MSGKRERFGLVLVIGVALVCVAVFALLRDPPRMGAPAIGAPLEAASAAPESSAEAAGAARSGARASRSAWWTSSGAPSWTRRSSPASIATSATGGACSRPGSDHEASLEGPCSRSRSSAPEASAPHEKPARSGCPIPMSGTWMKAASINARRSSRRRPRPCVSPASRCPAAQLSSSPRRSSGRVWGAWISRWPCTSLVCARVIGEEVRRRRQVSRLRRLALGSGRVRRARSVELELTTRARAKGHVSPCALWGSPVVVTPEASDFPFNVSVRRGRCAARRCSERRARPRDRRAHGQGQSAAARRLVAEPAGGGARARRACRCAACCFTRAHSAGTWTRPGTLAMLAGALSGDLGLNALPLIPAARRSARRLYAEEAGVPAAPPATARRGDARRREQLLHGGLRRSRRRHGLRALVDHRYALEDTDGDSEGLAAPSWSATRAGVSACSSTSSRRTCPTSPRRAPRPQSPSRRGGPADQIVRQYLAEIHKDDAAVGRSRQAAARARASRTTPWSSSRPTTARR